MGKKAAALLALAATILSLLARSASGQTYRQFTTSDGLSSSLVNCLYQDSYGIIWIATEDGLNKYDGVKITTYRHDPGNPNSLANNYVSSIIEDKAGNLVISTYRNVQIFRHSTNDFTPLATLPSGQALNLNISQMRLSGGRLYGVGDICCEIVAENQDSLHIIPMEKPFFSIEDFSQYPPELKVRSAIRYGQGTMLLGTDGDGVKLFSEKSGTYTSFHLDIPGLPQKLQKVHSMLRDRDGSLWFGMYQKGVVCVSQRSSKFGYIGPRVEQQNIIGAHCVLSICRSRNGGIWAGTDGDGIYLIEHGRAAHYADGLPPIVNALLEDSDGALWIGSYGYPCFRQAGRAAVKVPGLPPEPNVFCIAEDLARNVWLGTMGSGLYSYSLDSGIIRQAADPSLSRYINCLYVTPQGRVLAGTFNGVYDVQARKYLCHEYIVYSICQDSRHRIWAGTSEGLVMLDGHGVAQAYTTANGLPSNSIYAIREDSQERLWLSTNAGLSCLSLRDTVFANYTASDGIQGAEFSKNASLGGPGGTLWFAGHDGITYFSPQEISQARFLITPRITAMYIGNAAVTAKTLTGGAPVLDTVIYDCRRFSIAYENNSFSIELSASQLDIPEKTSFLYSLDGGPWLNIPQGSHLVSFSNLEAGHHVFRYMVEYNGIESQPREVEIIIRYPWWGTPWARAAYVLTPLLVLALFFFWLRGKEKIRVLSLISHKIRTPLSLIVSPLLQLMDSDGDSARQKTYRLMLRNATRLQHLASQATEEEPIGPIEEEAPPDGGPGLSQSRSAYQLVIAEDDADVRGYLCEQLSQYYHVRAASNGKEALGLVFVRQPDAIISDVTMPEMDGIALCKRLKKNIQLAHIPVVLLTARADEESQLQGLGIGADAYITKPFSIKILNQKVRNLILLRQQLKNAYQGQQLQEDKLEKMEAQSYDDKFMERLMAVVNAHISDCDLSIDTLCREVGISRAGLHRKLKERTNQSASIFVRNVRLKQSEALLLGTSLRVAEIAQKVGFRQASYYATSFRELYGMPPNEWREKAATESSQEEDFVSDSQNS